MALDDLARVGVRAQGRQARQITVIRARLRRQCLAARTRGVLEADGPLRRSIDRALASAHGLPRHPPSAACCWRWLG